MASANRRRVALLAPVTCGGSGKAHVTLRQSIDGRRTEAREAHDPSLVMPLRHQVRQLPLRILELVRIVEQDRRRSRAVAGELQDL